LRIYQKLDVSNKVDLLFYVLSHWRRHRMPCEANSQAAKVLGDCKFLHAALAAVTRER
jgi:hypothetical protein